MKNMMKTRSLFSFLLLTACFLLFSLVNNLMFSSVRVDLTENNLYTLSEGSKEIVDGLEEPINLYFFFSDKVSEDLTPLRAYSDRVREMLEEYALLGGDMVNLSVIDPEPFSEEEDQAAGFGLQAVPVRGGDEVYFGLAGTNAVDGREVIPFFRSEREEFLEYELTRLIYALSVVEKPKMGIYSGLPIGAGIDPQTGQPTQEWVFRRQLAQLFQIEALDAVSDEDLAGIDLLLLVHPKELPEADLYAIDQFVMSGGKLIAFVDPLAEMDRPETPDATPGSNNSEINLLTSAWGVNLRDGEVLGDPGTALIVNDANGRPVRHVGILGFKSANMSREDIVTAPLESINMSTAGILDVDEVDGITVERLVVSSDQAGSLNTSLVRFTRDIGDLQRSFVSSRTAFAAALRLSGSATSAFPEGLDDAENSSEHRNSTDELQVVIVADTDMLSDRLWVRVQNFFGQQIVNAFADNGTFISNLVDHLSGSSALITVRSRGQYTRPFEVVEEIRRKAEAEYQQSEEALQSELAETERQLAELESARVEDGVLRLSAEQGAALARFQQEKARIRKELRDVRHQLDRDIEQLGGMLKLSNILLMPLLLTGLLLLVIRLPGLKQRGEKM